MRKKKETFIVTGKTEDQMVSELKTLEFCEKEGIKVPSHISCYLCKREEGTNSVLLGEDKDSLRLPEIKLNAYEIDMGNGVVYCYWLCDECMLLLQDFAEQADTGDEDLES